MRLIHATSPITVGSGPAEAGTRCDDGRVRVKLPDLALEGSIVPQLIALMMFVASLPASAFATQMPRCPASFTKAYLRWHAEVDFGETGAWEKRRPRPSHVCIMGSYICNQYGCCKFNRCDP